MNAHKRN